MRRRDGRGSTAMLLLAAATLLFEVGRAVRMEAQVGWDDLVDQDLDMSEMGVGYGCFVSFSPTSPTAEVSAAYPWKSVVQLGGASAPPALSGADNGVKHCRAAAENCESLIGHAGNLAAGAAQTMWVIWAHIEDVQANNNYAVDTHPFEVLRGVCCKRNSEGLFGLKNAHGPCPTTSTDACQFYLRRTPTDLVPWSPAAALTVPVAGGVTEEVCAASDPQQVCLAYAAARPATMVAGYNSIDVVWNAAGGAPAGVPKMLQAFCCACTDPNAPGVACNFVQGSSGGCNFGECRAKLTPMEGGLPVREGRLIDTTDGAQGTIIAMQKQCAQGTSDGLCAHEAFTGQFAIGQNTVQAMWRDEQTGQTSVAASVCCQCDMLPPGGRGGAVHQGPGQGAPGANLACVRISKAPCVVVTSDCPEMPDEWMRAYADLVEGFNVNGGFVRVKFLVTRLMRISMAVANTIYSGAPSPTGAPWLEKSRVEGWTKQLARIITVMELPASYSAAVYKDAEGRGVSFGAVQAAHLMNHFTYGEMLKCGPCCNYNVAAWAGYVAAYRASHALCEKHRPTTPFDPDAGEPNAEWCPFTDQLP